MRFSDIIGQDDVKRRLARTVDEGRVSHAQMFTGAAGSGTLSLALAYIQYLNCPNRTPGIPQKSEGTSEITYGDSCGVCPSCQKIAALQHPDLHFVMPVNKEGKKSGEAITSDLFLPQWRKLTAETGGYFDEAMWYGALDLEKLQGLISKKEADEVIRKLSFKSFEGGFKAVVIWLPEKMNGEAANTLLKILEEPWERTLFVLVSAQPRMLLPTIISRVQEVAVPGIDPEAIETYFAARKVDPAKARLAARLSRGDMLQAQKIVNDENSDETGEDFELFVELMRLSYNDKHLELLKWAERAAALGRERQKRMLENFVRLTRSSFMINAGLEDIAYLWGAEMEFCRKFSPFIANHNVENIVAEIESAGGQLRRNGSAAIVFTHFALAVSKQIIKR
ncbi:MAG: DNA polymerase III subunit delta [Alistipes sp.]|jgi:DNA polymerase-3 subunit delta'|nr:DNA polymerase III subunit delta [Alistipes sp.]